MSTRFSWSGVVRTDNPSERAAENSSGNNASVIRPPTLCQELHNVGDMLSCAVFDINGKILCQDFGELKFDREVEAAYGRTAAMIWEGLRLLEVDAGPLDYANIRYKNFKVIGIPFNEFRIGVLAVIPTEIDSEVMKDRIIGFVRYWAEERGLIGHGK